MNPVACLLQDALKQFKLGPPADEARPRQLVGDKVSQTWVGDMIIVRSNIKQVGVSWAKANTRPCVQNDSSKKTECTEWVCSVSGVYLN